MSTFRPGFNKLADIASASSITTGPDGSYHDITGTTPILSMTSRRAGSVVLFRVPGGGVTFTHLTGTLNMRGKVNFTSKAGDLISFVSEGDGEWTELGRGSEETGLVLAREGPSLTMPTGSDWFTISEANPILTGGVFTGAATLTMPTGSNWFTESAARAILAGATNDRGLTLTMPTGASWFTESAARTHWACQNHLCC